MSLPRHKWFRSLQSSSLFRPPPRDAHKRQTEILAYVELFGQFTSEDFGDDIGELVHGHYPQEEEYLLDDVLANFVLHFPEHGHVVLHALLSCVIDGTIMYSRNTPPFRSFVSLFSPSNEKCFSGQWALACGETLRVLTHYNRLINVADDYMASLRSSESSACTANSSNSEGILLRKAQHITLNLKQDQKMPARLLTQWLTDCLLAAPLGIRSDYFRWCGGGMAKYATRGELKPLTADGAAVILGVCDDEVSRYGTADLTAAAVPALLLPPPTASADDHIVSGLPPLEPYAQLFHRYYAIATPSATQQLLLGLLEAPPSWATYAFDTAVKLVELLWAAENYGSSIKLPKGWLHLHFLQPIGAAMAIRSGIATDVAEAFLFQVFSQPALLFPHFGIPQVVQVMQPLYGPCNSFSTKQMEMEAEPFEKATALGIVSLLCDHGSDVEQRICAIWEASFGLHPLCTSKIDLPRLVRSAVIQPPDLTWVLFKPVIQVLECLSRGSPSETCLLKIFTATVEATLHRTFPLDRNSEHLVGGTGSKNLEVTELRAIVHSLFTEEHISLDLSARLISRILTVCLSYDKAQQGRRKTCSDMPSNPTIDEEMLEVQGRCRFSRHCSFKERGAVAAFDSYLVAAICALTCEMQLQHFCPSILPIRRQATNYSQTEEKHNASSYNEYQDTHFSLLKYARRLLSLLRALLTLVPATCCIDLPDSNNNGSDKTVAVATVAVHISEVLRQSKVCMHALVALMRCKWDTDLSTQAISVLALVERNMKVGASVDTVYSQNIQATIKDDMCEHMDVDAVAQSCEAMILSRTQSTVSQMQSVTSPQVCNNCDKEFALTGNEQKVDDFALGSSTSKAQASFPIDMLDVASLLCLKCHNKINGAVGTLIKAVLVEKEDLSVAAVPFVWQRLILSPELHTTGEKNSAKQGWYQVLEALCDLVLAFPVKATLAIVVQAERELQPWVDVRDSERLQQMWRANKRIVWLLSEILKLHSVPEAIRVVVNASDLLHRATDGMAIEGQACVLPQLKDRLPAIVQCLSNNSAHIQAMSLALLQDMVHLDPLKSRYHTDNLSPVYAADDKYAHTIRSNNNLLKLVQQCIVWEMRNHQAMGMSISILANAADSLGCSVYV